MCYSGLSCCEDFWWVCKKALRTLRLTCLLLAYFVITEPTRSSQWENGVANPVTWTKGVNDGIVMVDVELSRLSQDGLIFVARNGE
jgi:hypothetical protein